MDDISLMRYESDHKEGVLDLLSYHWNGLNAEERKKRFEWRYEKNPYTESPLCFVALDGEKVVGHRGFVVQKFRLREKDWLFCTPADSVVHPDYRRQGIFSNLIKFSKKELISNSNIDLILSLSANKASTEATLKAGYEPVGQREKMHYISPFRLLKNRLKSNDLEIPISIENKDFKIEINNELRVKKISSIMDEFKNEDQISNVKDKEFYEWRFSNPLKDYVFGYCTKKDELVGYVALDITSEKIISLLEYGYKDLSYFEELLKTIIKKLPVPIITAYVFTRPKKEKRVLSRCGFRDKNN